MAGTIESNRENSNKIGPRAREVRGLQEWLDDKIGIVIDSESGDRLERDTEAVKRAVGKFRGASSPSVSVSPAPRNPGAVVINLTRPDASARPFPFPNNLSRKVAANPGSDARCLAR